MRPSATRNQVALLFLFVNAIEVREPSVWKLQYSLHWSVSIHIASAGRPVSATTSSCHQYSKESHKQLATVAIKELSGCEPYYSIHVVNPELRSRWTESSQYIAWSAACSFGFLAVVPPEGVTCARCTLLNTLTARACVACMGPLPQKRKRR